MPYIFMDESGDLGFDFRKKGTSRNFIITFVFAPNKRALEKCVKKIYLGILRTQKKRSGVLHAVSERPITRIRLLKCLVDVDCAIITIKLNKQKVYTHLQDEKQVLYNYITNILLDRIMTKKLVDLSQTIVLVASRRETNKFFNENFKTYLSSQLSKKHKFTLNVEIKTPSAEKSLQATDFICWAIFRKYEHGDESYYDLIKGKILEENPLFP